MTRNVTEIVYQHAMDAIATGATRADTVRWLAEHYGSQSLKPGELNGILAEALDGAMSVGIEREDVDPSWF